MRTARTTQLNCYGGNSTPQRPRIALEFVDLGAEYDYFAWVTTPYWNAMPGSTLGSMNAVAADVLGEIPAGGVLYQTLPATTYSGKLGSYGSWSNLRPLACMGARRSSSSGCRSGGRRSRSPHRET